MKTSKPVFIGTSWTIEIKGDSVFITNALSASTYWSLDGKKFYQSNGVVKQGIPNYVKAKARSVFRNSSKRNPHRRLMSAKSVARRLKLRGLSNFKKIAKRTRKNCGCKRRSRR